MTDETNQHFDIMAFLDELIEEMDMKDEEAEKVEALKDAMFENLRMELFQAASDNLEPAVIDAVMEELEDETDPEFILQQLVQTSPNAQKAMLDALENFRNQTLEAYNHLKG